MSASQWGFERLVLLRNHVPTSNPFNFGYGHCLPCFEAVAS
jgi:hypothetical protein